MSTWIDRMVDQLDGMEDPNCCTKQEHTFCQECGEAVTDLGEWCTEDEDFCCNTCLREWMDKNWED